MTAKQTLPLVLMLIGMLTLPGTSAWADAAKTLEDAGLKKAGLEYIIDDETEIIRAQREIQLAQRELSSAQKAFRTAEKKIARAQSYIAGLQRGLQNAMRRNREGLVVADRPVYISGQSSPNPFQGISCHVSVLRDARLQRGVAPVVPSMSRKSAGHESSRVTKRCRRS